ncbi:hypothetical protein KSP40_PGU022439 [Platanthera guangdongensis]|uniref:Uncharacterized protein n=1 Tax=Platanthera guangdongensis TaxID=2320717 RepID=A0ABR2N1A7_9ASPA
MTLYGIMVAVMLFCEQFLSDLGKMFSWSYIVQVMQLRNQGIYLMSSLQKNLAVAI